MSGLFKKLNEDLPTKEINPKEFPNPGTKNDPKFFTKGKRDGGDKDDDDVETKKVGIPAKSLKASQDAVYLGKALGLAINGVVGGDLGAMISKDNRILDGHHRWAATIFNNPNAKIIANQSELVIGDLIPVLRQAGDALGNERGTMPKGGDVNIFMAKLDDVEDCIYRGMNMDQKFYDKDKSIAWYEKVGKKQIENGLALIKRNGPPPGAPPRQEMPKIEPEQVDRVAKALNRGDIDVRSPYANEGLFNMPTFEQFVFESAVNESKWSSIMDAVKKGNSGPWSIVAIKDNKVIGQKIEIKIKDAIPAHYEGMVEKYPKAIFRIEDSTGQIVWQSK